MGGCCSAEMPPGENTEIATSSSYSRKAGGRSPGGTTLVKLEPGCYASSSTAGSPSHAHLTPSGAPRAPTKGPTEMGDDLPLPVVDANQVQQFASERLTQGLFVMVILANGAALEVNMQLMSRQGQNDDALCLRRGTNTRVIPLKSIVKILSTPYQFSRIETSAELDRQCCGILMTSGTCITLRFDCTLDTVLFVRAMQNALDQREMIGGDL